LSAPPANIFHTVITTGALCREFLGRSAELEYLLDRALRSHDARSAAIIVRGNAGIGKTRLIDELARAAREGGARVGIGRAQVFARAPYLAIGDALRGLGVTLDAEAFAALGKARQFDEISDAVAAAARAVGPLVAIVDDLHAADGGTLELLQFLAHRLAGAPVLFVGTYRTEAIEDDSTRANALADLERESGQVITLEALPDLVMERVVASALGDGGARVPAETVSRIVELADGRPLFAEELLRGVLERLDRDRSGEPTVPTSIRASVHERFAALSDIDREVLLHAAVIGRRFSARFLTVLVEQRPAVVLAALRRGRDLQLVVEENDDDGDRFSFRHALTREAIYAELLRAEARVLHGRVAEKLAEGQPLDVTAAAEHFWRAGDPSAARWNERAGTAAVAVHSYADAVVHFERAFRTSTEAVTRAPLAEQLAGALYALGETERSAVWYELAAQEYEREVDIRRAWRLRLRHARVLVEVGDYEDGLLAADRVARSGEGADAELRFEADVMVAGLLAMAERAEDALERLQRAAKLGARPDAAVEARYAGALAFTLGALGRPDEARPHFDDALARARALGDDDLIGRTLNNAGFLELRYGPLEAARAIYRDGLQAAEARKDRRHLAAMLMSLALVALIAGELDEARALYARAATIEHGARRVRRWTQAIEFRRATLCGENVEPLPPSMLAELELALRDNDLESAERLGGALACAAALAGRAADAGEIAGRVVAVLDRIQGPHWLVDAATRFGEPLVRERAQELIAAAAAHAQALPARGWLELTRSRAATRARRRDEAQAHADHAAGLFRRAGWALDEAYALEAAGRTADALAIFRRIGALAEVRRLSGGAAGRQRGDATLTAREREIASLLAAGHTARAIAERLIISERTVETHVAAVYRKLGVANRQELSTLLAVTGV
jgi:predicted ATPase/DNA-binding CsgD family transcriptional regulator